MSLRQRWRSLLCRITGHRWYAPIPRASYFDRKCSRCQNVVLDLPPSPVPSSPSQPPASSSSPGAAEMAEWMAQWRAEEAGRRLAASRRGTADTAPVARLATAEAYMQRQGLLSESGTGEGVRYWLSPEDAPSGSPSSTVTADPTPTSSTSTPMLSSASPLSHADSSR